MRSYILAHTNEINLVHRAEAQNPASVRSLCQHSVVSGRLIGLLQVVPLSR